MQMGTANITDAVTLWGIEIGRLDVDSNVAAYILTLPKDRPSVQWLWGEMDRIWNGFGLDNNRPLSTQRIAEFYSHPIWLVNGVFTAMDPESAGHRRSIAAYIRDLDVTQIADYGGGFGQLAVDIVAECPDASVSIVEPFPSKVALGRIEKLSRA